MGKLRRWCNPQAQRHQLARVVREMRLQLDIIGFARRCGPQHQHPVVVADRPFCPEVELFSGADIELNRYVDAMFFQQFSKLLCDDAILPRIANIDSDHRLHFGGRVLILIRHALCSIFRLPWNEVKRGSDARAFV